MTIIAQGRDSLDNMLGTFWRLRQDVGNIIVNYQIEYIISHPDKTPKKWHPIDEEPARNAWYILRCDDGKLFPDYLDNNGHFARELSHTYTHWRNLPKFKE
jgi:hypothetical protein